MYLRPSDIRFSQDSIGRTFGRCTSHPYKPIGETLDDILKGLINVNCIPGISVYKKDGLWFTAGNRRLWVLQEAEKRGMCSEIYVRETFCIDYNKFTTINNGISVFVRGNPGGYLWQTMPITKMKLNRPPKTAFCPTKPPGLTSSFKYKRHTEKKNTGELPAKHSKHRVPAIHERIMSKRGEGLRFGQKVSKNFDKMSAHMGNQYSTNVDSYSENDNVDENISNLSPGSGASQQNDIAYGWCQKCGIAKPRESEVKVNTTKEKKIVEKKKIRDDTSALINGPSISGIQNYNTFLRSNSDTFRRPENKNVAVTISDENNARFHKCTIYDHCLAFFVFFLIVAFIVLLGFIISIATF